MSMWFSISICNVIAFLVEEAFTMSAAMYSKDFSNFQLVQSVFPQITSKVINSIPRKALSRVAMVNFDLKLVVSEKATSFSRNINSICLHLYENISWREEVCGNCIGDILRQNIIVKSNSLSQSINLSQSSISFDGNIIYSHYFYSSITGSTVCSIGYFIPASIISILLMNPNNEVIYISFMEDIRDDEFFEDLRSLQSMFNNFRLRMKGESLDCVTVHVLGGTENLAELERSLQRLPSSSQMQNIVWEQIYGEFENYLDVAIPYGKSKGSSQSGVIEFDSVGRWFAGKSDYSRNYDYDETDNIYRVGCRSFAQYQLIHSHPIEVYMGTIQRLEKKYQESEDCDQGLFEDSMYFITYEASAFFETAEGISDALHRAGFLNVVLMGSFNRTTYLYLRNNYCKNSLIQISIGCDGLHILT